jgi:hypothetical protein
MGIDESGEADASSASEVGARIAEARAGRGLTSAELEELLLGQPEPPYESILSGP